MLLKPFFSLILLVIFFQTGCTDKEEPQPTDFAYGQVSFNIDGKTYAYGLTRHTYNEMKLVQTKGDDRLKFEFLLPNDGVTFLSLEAGTYGINHAGGEEVTLPVLLEIEYMDTSSAEKLRLRGEPQSDAYFHTVEYIKYLDKEYVGNDAYHAQFEIKGHFQGRVNNWNWSVVKDISGSYKIRYAANPI